MPNPTVTLTRSQCANLAEFIEFHLFDEIRNNPEIDNIEWVCDMVGAYRALQEAADGE